jgi:hypothetical protein
MGRYNPLPDHIREALGQITPSKDGELEYFPCRVTLDSGQELNNVYIEPEDSYMKVWDVYPEEDGGKKSVRIEQVIRVDESPSRLPAQIANEIYRNGESGMGYTVFTIVFADGSRQACVTGNAVDFIDYPDGKGPADVLEVLPHEGRDKDLVRAPEWYWCLYSESHQ